MKKHFNPWAVLSLSLFLSLSFLLLHSFEKKTKSTQFQWFERKQTQQWNCNASCEFESKTNTLISFNIHLEATIGGKVITILLMACKPYYVRFKARQAIQLAPQKKETNQNSIIIPSQMHTQYSTYKLNFLFTCCHEVYGVAMAIEINRFQKGWS